MTTSTRQSFCPTQRKHAHSTLLGVITGKLRTLMEGTPENQLRALEECRQAAEDLGLEFCEACLAVEVTHRMEAP